MFNPLCCGGCSNDFAYFFIAKFIFLLLSSKHSLAWKQVFRLSSLDGHGFLRHFSQSPGSVFILGGGSTAGQSLGREFFGFGFGFVLSNGV